MRATPPPPLEVRNISEPAERRGLTQSNSSPHRPTANRPTDDAALFSSDLHRGRVALTAGLVLAAVACVLLTVGGNLAVASATADYQSELRQKVWGVGDTSNSTTSLAVSFLNAMTSTTSAGFSFAVTGIADTAQSRTNSLTRDGTWSTTITSTIHLDVASKVLQLIQMSGAISTLAVVFSSGVATYGTVAMYIQKSGDAYVYATATAPDAGAASAVYNFSVFRDPASGASRSFASVAWGTKTPTTNNTTVQLPNTRALQTTVDLIALNGATVRVVANSTAAFVEGLLTGGVPMSGFAGSLLDVANAFRPYPSCLAMIDTTNGIVAVPDASTLCTAAIAGDVRASLADVGVASTVAWAFATDGHAATPLQTTAIADAVATSERIVVVNAIATSVAACIVIALVGAALYVLNKSYHAMQTEYGEALMNVVRLGASDAALTISAGATRERRFSAVAELCAVQESSDRLASRVGELQRYLPMAGSDTSSNDERDHSNTSTRQRTPKQTSSTLPPLPPRLSDAREKLPSARPVDDGGVPPRWRGSLAPRSRSETPITVGGEKSEDKADVRLRRRQVTVLATSFTGFLAIAESNGAEAHECSQAYLQIVLKVVERNGGTVVNFTADRVIVTWNAFSDDANHVCAAASCAIEIVTTLAAAVDMSLLPDMPMPTVVVGGNAVAGHCGDSWERVPVVWGDCVDFSVEALSLVGSIGVACAVSKQVAEAVRHLAWSVPIDTVTGPNDLVVELHELRQGPEASYCARVREAFHFLMSEQPEKAVAILQDVVQEAPEEDTTPTRLLRLSQLFHKLQVPYLRSFPSWQRYPPEEANVSSPTHITPRVSGIHKAAMAADEFLRAELLAMKEEAGEGHFASSLNAAIKTASMMAPAPPQEVMRPTVVEFTDARKLTYRMSKRLLGRGAVGEVLLGMTSAGTLVAMKSVPLPRMEGEVSASERRRLKRKGIAAAPAATELDALLNEVSLLSRLRHENIVGYISSAIVERKSLVLVMEYISGGSLQSLIKEFKSIPLVTARRYLRDTLRGLQFLHQEGIVHRDIKPSNILMLVDGTCKLSDFGTCNRVSTLVGVKSATGTPQYMAPEAALGEATMASDIWSFGISMAEILVGELPWPSGEEHPQRFLYRLAHDETVIPMISSTLPPEAAVIVARCCQRDARQRPMAGELLQNSFFASHTSAPAARRPRAHPTSPRTSPHVSRVSSAALT